MLDYLLNIRDYSFMGLDIIHVEKFNALFLRFVFNISIVFVIVRLLYYPTVRRKDYLFSLLLISVVVFTLCYLLENVKLQMGFAFGLFAIFGILRYRTLPIPIKEMTYLFIIIGISVINALTNKKTSWAELIFVNAAITLIVFVLEKLWLVKHESSKQMNYDKIDLILPEKRSELIKDIEKRTGLKINRIEIGRIDYVRNFVRLIVYYYDNENQINLADMRDSDYNRDDDD